MGNPFSATGHLGIYNIMRGPHEMISLQISLLWVVTHLTPSPRRPNDSVVRLRPEDWMFPTPAPGNDARRPARRPVRNLEGM